MAVFTGEPEATFFRVYSIGGVVRIDPENTEEIQTATTMTSGNRVNIQAEIVYFTMVVQLAQGINVRRVLNSLIRKLLCANAETSVMLKNNKLVYCDKVLAKLIACFEDVDVAIAIDQVIFETRMNAMVLGEIATGLQKVSREFQQTEEIPQSECLRFLQQIVERCEVLSKTKKVS